MKKLRNSILAAVLLAVAGATVPVKNVSAMHNTNINIGTLNTSLKQPANFTVALRSLNEVLTDVNFANKSGFYKKQIFACVGLAMQNIARQDFNTQENVELLINLLQNAQNQFPVNAQQINAWLHQGTVGEEIAKRNQLEQERLEREQLEQARQLEQDKIIGFAEHAIREHEEQAKLAQQSKGLMGFFKKAGTLLQRTPQISTTISKVNDNESSSEESDNESIISSKVSDNESFTSSEVSDNESIIFSEVNDNESSSEESGNESYSEISGNESSSEESDNESEILASQEINPPFANAYDLDHANAKRVLELLQKDYAPGFLSKAWNKICNHKKKIILGTFLIGTTIVTCYLYKNQIVTVAYSGSTIIGTWTIATGNCIKDKFKHVCNEIINKFGNKKGFCSPRNTQPDLNNQFNSYGTGTNSATQQISSPEFELPTLNVTSLNSHFNPTPSIFNPNFNGALELANNPVEIVNAIQQPEIQLNLQPTHTFGMQLPTEGLRRFIRSLFRLGNK